MNSDDELKLPDFLPCSNCGEVFNSAQILITKTGPPVLWCTGCAEAKYNAARPAEGICFTCKEPFLTDDLNVCLECGAQYCCYDPIAACDCSVAEYINQLEESDF